MPTSATDLLLKNTPGYAGGTLDEMMQTGMPAEEPPRDAAGRAVKTVTPDEKKSFWDRLSMNNTLMGVPASGWFGLASAMWGNAAYDPRTGQGGWTQGLAQGLPALGQSMEEARRRDAFAQWMNRNPGALDPELAGLLPPEQIAAAVIGAQMSPKSRQPVIKDFQVGEETVTAQYDPRTGEWMEIARGPRWNPRGEAESRARYQQSGAVRLPDGRIVNSRFDPYGGYEYRDESGQWRPLPPDARPTTPSQGGALTPQQFMKARQELAAEQLAINKLSQYYQTIGDTNMGIRRWADAIAANAKTLFGAGRLDPKELALKAAQGQVQGLLGLFREDIVGPGVMTEYDAQRVLAALGGDVTALQNPQVVESLLRGLLESKMQRAQVLYEEIARSAPVYGTQIAPIAAPGIGGAPAPAAGKPPGEMSDEELLRALGGR